MNIEAFQNCTENGEIFSCFLKIGETENMIECEKRCKLKTLYAFQLKDFYNFADRLNQSNFLGQTKSPQFNSSSIEFSQKRKTHIVSLITIGMKIGLEVQYQ